MKEKINELKEKGNDFRKEVRERTLGYVLAALGLVAGLSWNETIKAFIEYLFPLSQNTLIAKFIYSILITVVVVLVSIYMTRLFSEKK